MAQQTINVGTAPNDGTGTPLRTAFQYTNSNFSELYTAVGPSGNNIVVPGNATISGDLTVATNTLKTTSGNVGIGTVTPDIFGRFYTRTIGFNSSGSTVMQINGSSYSGIDLGAGGTRTFGIASSATDASLTTLTNIPIVFGINGSEAMRLNSTGLGVGVASPATKLDVRGATNANQATFSGTAGRGLLISTRSDGLADDRTVVLNAQFATGSLGQLVIQTAGTDRLLVDSSGNVGIGVTPSAWSGISAKVLEFGNSGSNNSLWGNGTNDLHLVSNAYFNGANWIYNRTAAVTRYNQLNGSHAWYTAPSGTAGNAITFTQAMTLDASGNLLVGTTSALSAVSGSSQIALGGAGLQTTSQAISAATATTICRSGSGGMAVVGGYNGTGQYSAIIIFSYGSGGGVTVVSSQNNTGSTITYALSGVNVQVTSSLALTNLTTTCIRTA